MSVFYGCLFLVPDTRFQIHAACAARISFIRPSVQGRLQALRTQGMRLQRALPDRRAKPKQSLATLVAALSAEVC